MPIPRRPAAATAPDLESFHGESALKIIWIDAPDRIERMRAEMTERYGERLYVRPASTMVVVAGLLDPAWLVEIEADAMLDD